MWRHDNKVDIALGYIVGYYLRRFPHNYPGLHYHFAGFEPTLDFTQIPDSQFSSILLDARSLFGDNGAFDTARDTKRFDGLQKNNFINTGHFDKPLHIRERFFRHLRAVQGYQNLRVHRLTSPASLPFTYRPAYCRSIPWYEARVFQCPLYQKPSLAAASVPPWCSTAPAALHRPIS